MGPNLQVCKHTSSLLLRQWSVGQSEKRSVKRVSGRPVSFGLGRNGGTHYTRKLVKWSLPLLGEPFLKTVPRLRLSILRGRICEPEYFSSRRSKNFQPRARVLVAHNSIFCRHKKLVAGNASRFAVVGSHGRVLVSHNNFFSWVGRRRSVIFQPRTRPFCPPTEKRRMTLQFMAHNSKLCRRKVLVAGPASRFAVVGSQRSGRHKAKTHAAGHGFSSL